MRVAIALDQILAERELDGRARIALAGDRSQPGFDACILLSVAQRLAPFAPAAAEQAEHHEPADIGGTHVTALLEPRRETSFSRSGS